MESGMLSEVRDISKRRTKARKVLQTLQVTVNEEIITDKNMVNPDDETLPLKEKEPKSNEKLKLTEKENAVQNVRRSKRKAALASTVKYVESPEVPKTAKSIVKSTSKPKKTTKSKKAVKKAEQAKLNQTKINFSPIAESTTLKGNIEEFKSDESEKCVVNTSTTESTEDSGFDPSPGISDQSPKNSTAILHSPDAKNCVIPDEVSMLTADTQPLSYWRRLAEQRRIALEKALHENELLYDQLTVLEAENLQLNQLVKEAEHLASVVKAIVE